MNEMTPEEEELVKRLARRVQGTTGLVLRVKTGTITLSGPEERDMDAICKKLGKSGVEIINSYL